MNNTFIPNLVNIKKYIKEQLPNEKIGFVTMSGPATELLKENNNDFEKAKKNFKPDEFMKKYKQVANLSANKKIVRQKNKQTVKKTKQNNKNDNINSDNINNSQNNNNDNININNNNNNNNNNSQNNNNDNINNNNNNNNNNNINNSQNNNNDNINNNNNNNNNDNINNSQNNKNDNININNAIASVMVKSVEMPENSR